MSTNFKGIAKKDWELAAELKTIADYALILEHCNGFSKGEARKSANESQGETLFELLHARNKELFKTGDIRLM